jgi:hypothetical protein
MTGRWSCGVEEIWFIFDPFRNQLSQGLRGSMARDARAARIGRGKVLSPPFSFIRTVTVGFGIAPKSADPPADIVGKRSRAHAKDFAITAGGELHPALRTSCRITLIRRCET